MDPMLEQAAPPAIPGLRRRLSKVAQALTTPLLPDDYLALLDPRWSTREACGTVVRIDAESPSARTLVIEPNFDWPGHVPGQYLRLGVEIDGIRHWRAYSITSDPGHPSGLVSVTVQRVEGGLVSPFLVDRCEVGASLFLGAVEGEFVLEHPVPAKLLLITAGCGITPVMAMVRQLGREGKLGDVVHLHGSRTAGDFIFGAMLRELSVEQPGYRLHEQHSAATGRLHRQDLDKLVPDWQTRAAYLSGPTEMMLDFERHWSEHGDPALLRKERFRPDIGHGGDTAFDGGGGSVAFRVSGLEVDCEPGVSILVAGERAGAQLPHGCRMGICHSCIGRLQSGQVRDLRTGTVHGEAGQPVRTCVNAPEGAIEIEL